MFPIILVAQAIGGLAKIRNDQTISMIIMTRTIYFTTKSKAWRASLADYLMARAVRFATIKHLHPLFVSVFGLASKGTN